MDFLMDDIVALAGVVIGGLLILRGESFGKHLILASIGYEFGRHRPRNGT